MDRNKLHPTMDRKPRGTRIESFLRGRGIRPSHLARDAGISRQHLMRLRRGMSQPTLKMMIVLATAARRILGRTVEVSEMFDIDPKRRRR
jgi:transcriptional regulator with XRE-family HTH domain